MGAEQSAATGSDEDDDLSDEEVEFETAEEEEVKSLSDDNMKGFYKSEFPVVVSPQVFDIREEITQIRRYFHANPELSYKEVATAANIAQYLRKLDIEVKEKVAQTGVVGFLKGKFDGPCIMLRADMDALPVTEEFDSPFKSKKAGVMHACGHDCHMAILLGTARVLSKLRQHLHGSVKFVFQPAEEGYAGAKAMVEEGVLENPHVDQVYGLHVWSYQRFGQVTLRPGPLMSGAALFTIEVKGLGGHGGVPHGTKDAILAASQLVTQLHSIVSRNVSPLDAGVVSIGKLEAGAVANAIADYAKLDGTIRWFKPDVLELLTQRMREVCSGIETSFGVEIALKFSSTPYPPTVNHKKGIDNLRNAVAQVLPNALATCEGPPTMCAEDFSFFLQERPGAFFFLGCGVDGDTVYPHHKSNFQVDERCLSVGCQIMTTLTLELLLPPRKEDVATLAKKMSPSLLTDTPVGPIGGHQPAAVVGNGVPK